MIQNCILRAPARSIRSSRAAAAEPQLQSARAGNLRELALARMARLGLRCRDVRTREVGIQDIHNRVLPRDVELVRRDYTANGGWETFLAYEDPRQDILVGLLRLRRLAGAAKDRQPGLHGAPGSNPVRHACAACMCRAITAGRSRGHIGAVSARSGGAPPPPVNPVLARFCTEKNAAVNGVAVPFAR